MVIKVGCCGWAVRGGKQAYYKSFNIIELQETFYKLPRIETVKTWREEAPSNFEFTVKAWQAVTHPVSSPTWKKAGIKVPAEKADRYGHLRPTEEVFDAWEKTLEVCKALSAKVCVIQTPPSFGLTDENLKNARDFFSSITRGNVILAWEPRGNWNEHLDVVKEICDDNGLVHVVDIFRRRPVSERPIGYIRLHGIGRGEVNYRYKYTNEDLSKLKEEVLSIEERGKEVYVLFNNIYMADDAKRFIDLLSR